MEIGAGLLRALRADIEPACELSRCVCESGKGGCCYQKRTWGSAGAGRPCLQSQFLFLQRASDAAQAIFVCDACLTNPALLALSSIGSSEDGEKD